MIALALGFCVLLLLGVWFHPLFQKTSPALPVLLWQQSDARKGIPLKSFEKLLAALQRKHFSTILPGDILSASLPKQPVLLVLANGYQSYMQILPLLEKYNARIALALPVGLVGQYDAWNVKGPWQNLLTAEQIKTLHATKRIAFISQTLDNLSLDTLDVQQSAWQLAESKTRLKNLYHLPVQTILYPCQTPHGPAVLNAAQKLYTLQIGRQCGNNPWPLAAGPLRVFEVTNHTCLIRLMWKMRRP